MGFIGAGRVAAQHADALADLGTIQPVGVADPRLSAATALAGRLGVPAHDDYHALLVDSTVDAVDIAVPHDLHFPIARDALEAGKHVIMDKPLAVSVADGEHLVRLARDRGRTLSIIHNLLFHPAIQRCGELVRAGRIGQIRTATAWSRGWLDLAPDDFRRSKTRTGGGAWFDNGPHLLYVLKSLLGPVDRCVVFTNRGASRLEAEDSACGVAAFASGATATLRISYAEAVDRPGSAWPEGWSEGVEVAGTDGWIRADVAPAGRLAARYGATGRESTQRFVEPFSVTFAGALSDFEEAIRANRPLLVEPEAGLDLLQLTLSSPSPNGGS